MTLLHAHRILIGAALLLFVLYGALVLAGRLDVGGPHARRVQGGLSLLVAAALGAYLVRLSRSSGPTGRP